VIHRHNFLFVNSLTIHYLCLIHKLLSLNIMQPRLSSEQLSTLSEADFKKLLKKDKPFLKKAQAVLFCQDYMFADNKKSLSILFFRKPKDAKETFKAFFISDE